MKLREFTKTKVLTETYTLVTDEEAGTTSIMKGSKCIASFQGAFSEIAEEYYYDALRKAADCGWTIS